MFDFTRLYILFYNKTINRVFGNYYFETTYHTYLGTLGVINYRAIKQTRYIYAPQFLRKTLHHTNKTWAE